MIPKFRAWHKELKKMFDVKSLVFTIGTATIASRDDIVPSRNVSFDELVIMQSTGLFDMNGVEIFEGDVVYDSAVDEIGQIYISDCCFRAKTLHYDSLMYKLVGDLEVIGNVCEDPELMGENK